MLKKIVSLICVTFILCTLFFMSVLASPESQGTVTKIGISSDIHISADTSVQQKMKNSLTKLNSVPGGLDAMVFVGDLTDNGTPQEMKRFRSIIDEVLDENRTKITAVMGNHEFYNYGWGVSVDLNAGMKEEMQGWFTEYVGVDVEDEIVVNGIHILSVSPDNEMDSYQSREAFLKEKIQAAAAENGKAPIFIIAHKPVRYTVMSSGEAPNGSYISLAADWSDEFIEFLKNYPQIVYISGHAHDDIGNPETIYQQDFTAIQAGVTEGTPSTGLLITVDENYVVTIDRKNFTDDTEYSPAWVIDIPAVVESKSNFTYREVNTVKNPVLTADKDQNTLNVSWLNSTPVLGSVQLARAADVVDGVATNFQTFTAYAFGSASADAGYYYNHAVIENLEPNTAYLYRVGNENGWSPFYSYITGPSDGEFNFILTGDPQIGSGDSVSSDEAGWLQTINTALQAFPNTRFIISPGDQIDHANSATQYDSFLKPLQLRSIPLLTAVGNHDVTSPLYSQYFSYAHVSDYGKSPVTGDSSGDYSYLYNNALIMVINSNNQNIQEHRNFMQQALLDAGRQAKWKIVVFHHAIFSAGEHSEDAEVLTLRSELAPLLSDLAIDVVLTGHDHVYTRSYMMEGTVPDRSNGIQSSVDNPGAGKVVYFTVSSASGSKFYELYGTHDFDAVKSQDNRPQFSNIQVTDTTLTVTTYFTEDMSEVDSFTIHKTATLEKDVVKPYLFLPVKNEILLGDKFDTMEGVSAKDNDGTDLTSAVSCQGEVHTDEKGVYTLTYTVSDKAGNTTTLQRVVSVVSAMTEDRGLYYGLDIVSGEMKDEAGTVPAIWYNTPDSFHFIQDEILCQTVLQIPEEGYAEINGLNMTDLDNQYTIELFVKIPGTSITASNGYEIFQIGAQNVNLCGFPDPRTFFGAGRSDIGDADVRINSSIPADQWLHIVCTATEGEQILYINGEVFGRSTYTGLDCASSVDSVLRLGGSAYGRVGGMRLAYFRIYRGYSTASQVKEMQQALSESLLPADYTAVDAALAAIPQDLSSYTEQSVDMLNTAVAQVIRGKNILEQDVVDAMAQAIEDAIAGLDYMDIEESPTITPEPTQPPRVPNVETGNTSDFPWTLVLFMLLTTAVMTNFLRYKVKAN